VPDLLCPKCRVDMDTVERSGLTIEHCPDCGGVFLDRGELERLEVAEAPGLPAAPTGPPQAGAGGQALVGELMNLARQYRGGGRSRF